MKVLVISRSPWRMDNSFGNSYTNFFCRMKNVEVANIFLADGFPDNNENVTAYYKVSENQMIKSIKTKKHIGEVISAFQTQQKTEAGIASESSSKYRKILNFMKVKRWPLLYILRECVWKLGNMDYDGIFTFVEQFNPDVLFLPCYYALYVSELALKIKERFNIPIILEVSTDIYTLKQISFDPFFWINRFFVRKCVRKVVDKSEFMYTISEKQRKEYESLLGIPCRVLYKYPDPTRKLYEYSGANKPLKFLYTGNLGARRWKTLANAGRLIHSKQLGSLDIYSLTPITSKMKKAMRFCNLHSPVSADIVKQLQNEADVLVHVESFNLKNKLLVRYAISTKIMDYISTCRCILAIGPNDIASIQFLQNTNAALCATNYQQLDDILNKIKADNSVVSSSAKRIANYYESRINSEQLQAELYNGINSVIS